MINLNKVLPGAHFATHEAFESACKSGDWSYFTDNEVAGFIGIFAIGKLELRIKTLENELVMVKKAVRQAISGK